MEFFWSWGTTDGCFSANQFNVNSFDGLARREDAGRYRATAASLLEGVIEWINICLSKFRSLVQGFACE